MQSLLFSPHRGDHPGAMTNPKLCSLTPRGQLRLLREDTECLGFTRPNCWHVDRWRGCLSAAVCYRHLIAIDSPLAVPLIVNPLSITHASLQHTCCTPKLKLHPSDGFTSVFNKSPLWQTASELRDSVFQSVPQPPCALCEAWVV